MNDADKGGDASPDGVALPYGVAPPFYRLPAATGLGRVRLEVADLERSLDYDCADRRQVKIRLIRGIEGQAR